MDKNNKVPTVFEILESVRLLDTNKKGSPEYQSQHKKTVSKILEYNGFHKRGKFNLSISKARNIIQEQEKSEK
jgi:hypothetical protein